MMYNNYSNFTNLISFSNVIFECIINYQVHYNYITILEKAVLTFKYNYILLSFFTVNMI